MRAYMAVVFAGFTRTHTINHQSLLCYAVADLEGDPRVPWKPPFGTKLLLYTE